MGNPAFLSVGRGITSVAVGNSVPGGISDPRDPMAGGNRTLLQSSGRVGFAPEFLSGLGEVMQGRLSLLMLNSFIVLLLAFYVWTHRVQGGG